jgi:hypothetical protein
MGFLTNLVEQFFGKLKSGLAEEYQRQANKAGIHPIVAESIHRRVIENYIIDEKNYLTSLKYFKNNPEKIEELKAERMNFLIEHWGSEVKYSLFKKKQDKENEKIKNSLMEYNKRVQKEKDEFLKKYNGK